MLAKPDFPGFPDARSAIVLSIMLNGGVSVPQVTDTFGLSSKDFGKFETGQHGLHSESRLQYAQH